MAKGDRLPDTDHFARGCERGFDGTFIAAAAFGLRHFEKKLGQISGDWVECKYDVPERRNIEGSLHRLKAMKLRPQPVAFLRVSGVRHIRRNGQPLDAVEDGHELGMTQCHSAIVGFTGGPLDLEFQVALAGLANKGQIVQLT